MKHFTIKFALSLFALTFLAFDGKSQIYGTNSVLSISANTATVVDPGLTITETGLITDFNVQIMNGYEAGSSGDLLSYTGSLPSGVTASYDSDRGVLKFSGTTSASNWQTLLRTVTLRSTSAACYSQKRNVAFVLGNKYYNPSNGHYYSIGAANTSWVNSNSIANASTYYGRQGYLSTITTLDENNFVFSIVMNGNNWLGGSDDYVLINAATGATTYANQTLSDGNFYWVTGPEAGTHFSTGNTWEAGGTVAVSDRFMKWDVGFEPNDYPNTSTSNPGEENYAQFWYGNQWNDASTNDNNYGVFEYGDMPLDNQDNNIAHSTRNILINSAPSGVISGDVYVCSGSTSATITLTAPSGGYSSITRWESSLDRYFTNPTTISNTTTTLNLSGLTQNAYYRAIVNKSSPSCSNLPTSSVRVLLDNPNGTWKGTTSTDWSAAGNWCGGLPTLSTDVIINPGTPFNPKADNNGSTNRCKNLKMNSGTYLFFDNNERLEIAGTITSNHNINATNGEISIDGSSVQSLPANAFTTVSGSNTIQDLRIDNAAGVNLVGNLILSDDLTFVSGLLNTSSSNLLSFADNSGNITGAGVTKYVNGPLRKIGNDEPFVFEIGSGGKYAPCAMDNLSSNSNTQYFTAEYVKNPYGNQTFDASLKSISGKEYWLINRSGTSTIDLSLYYTDATFSGIVNTNISHLVVAHFNSTSNMWEDLFPSTPANKHVTNVSGTTYKVTMDNVNSFSPFTFGSPSGFNPLPVKLLNFVAIPDFVSKTVELNWETTMEENCNYFEVLHSVDFEKWDVIGKLNSKGNHNQLNSYSYNHLNPSTINYYRLRQVDNNGDFSNSDIKQARFTGYIDKVTVYPNPSIGTGSISIINASEDTNYEITDLTGKMIQQGNFSNSIDIHNLPKGVYIIKIVSEGFIQNDKIIIQ